MEKSWSGPGFWRTWRAWRTSLEELGGGRPKVVTTRAADYRDRVILEPEAWTSAAAAMAAEVDYPNFKDWVHGDPARDQTYMAVWSAMYRLQESQER